MGGGDLNLKKSWHPCTMKNIEKVWKAEQQQNQERKKIAELKKEIEMEKDREDMTKYAMDQGVIEKKDNKKLDWMYKGPNQMINREEYLLGRPIDKSFEQMVQAEGSVEQSQGPRNHVEHECIPPSLRFFSGNEQVDLARKMQEDPLYAIKKKEMETRNQLLKNPVKLKQLRLLLEEQSKKTKAEKKYKKKKKHKQDSDDDDDDETELDMLLAAKFKELKNKISDKDLIKSMKKIKHKRKKKSKKDTDDSSESESEETYSEEEAKRTKKQSKKYAEKPHDSKERMLHKGGEYSLSRDKGFRSRNPRNDSHRSRYNDKNNSGDNYFSNRTNNKDRQRKQLSEKEKERRRQEMIANASWRDIEREKNVKRYREEEKIEKQESSSKKVYNQEFVRKQLAVAAEVETVASRIKANINNIQRSGHAMNTNFAKR